MSETAGKVIKCRAAIAWAANEPLQIEDIEVAPPKKGEVRVKILYTAVCHSDIHVIEGNMGDKFPVILGHEAAGVVESVGEGVSQFKEGDHVIPLYCPQCKDCDACCHRISNVCDKMDVMKFIGSMADGTDRFTCKGKSISRFMSTSTFTQYTVVEEYCLVKIRDSCPLDRAALIGCGVATGYGAAINTAKITPGSKCIIFGMGAIGLAAVVGAKAAGASIICAIDINADKFEKAKQLGATHCVNPKDCPEGTSFEAWIMTQFGGAFDQSIECVGNITCMHQAFSIVRKGWGTCVIIGVAPATQKMEIIPAQFIIGKTITGSMFGGWKSVDDVPRLVDDYLNGKIDIDAFITCRGTLDDIQEAINKIKRSEGIRTVLKMFDD